MKRKFKVNDNVIGIQYPDNIPAKVVELINTDSNFNFVKIEYKVNDKIKTSIIPEYRLKLYNN